MRGLLLLLLLGCTGGEGSLGDTSAPTSGAYTFTYGCYHVAITDTDLGTGSQRRYIEQTYPAQGGTLQTEETWRGSDPQRGDRYAYVRDGDTAEVILDYGMDGDIDDLLTYTYDDEDRIIAAERDTDADGEPDVRGRYSYDAGGRLLESREDTNADGIDDLIKTLTYTDAGDVASQVTDADADGEPDNRLLYVYDARGRLLRETYDKLDGDLVWQVDHTYSDDGLYHERHADDGADGIVDSRSSDSYDARGNLVLQAGDDDADGVTDDLLEYSYDGDDRLIQADLYIGLADPKHQQSSRTTYQHDAQGRLIEQRTDDGIDGVDDDLEELVYTDGC